MTLANCSRVQIHYERAPIVEAVIHIGIDPLDSVLLPSLKAINQSSLTAYPDSKRKTVSSTQFTLGLAPLARSAVSASAEIGYAFTSADDRQVLQARLDGLAFSRLTPYETWNELRNQAKNWWAVYRSAIGPAAVQRVAVRYINRIDIPFPGYLNYKDYFRTSPELSPDLPQGLSEFYMRLGVPLPPHLGCHMIITMSTTVPPGPDTHSVILYLDVFKNTPGFGSDEEIWALLEKLREIKNSFFYGCLTDKARELFGTKREYT
jgi:uncharacterized protein (TIGR04255 family)